ncbi:MAG: hypothetical protein IT529_02895 [Burkholderiales bacterium]|nr:hypothetical protein [Burkholderiales bacterium]
MGRKIPHPSDSDAQRDAEEASLRELEKRLGFPVAGERVELGDGCFANVDGINRERRFICEIYSRIGKLQAAQVEKVASDVLKLGVLERALGGAWRKAMCFADKTAANVLRNKSWLAKASKDLGVEVIVLSLPDTVRSAVLAAQTRQVMVNRATSDG